MRNHIAGSIVVLAAIVACCPVTRGPERGRPGARNEVKPLRPLLTCRSIHTIFPEFGRAGATWVKTPAMTPWAQARYDAAKPGLSARGEPLGNDPMMMCDPVGYPRIAFYNAYPMEFLQTKDRLVEFFDYFYVHRTIYLDGRPLPADPDPTWYGYSVGHWDGNTLVVETNGFNDRSWVDNDGHPHSDEMKLEERFQRVDHDTIQATMTLTDPKAYTAPWVGMKSTWTLNTKLAMREDVCVPSDEEKYKEEMRVPAATPKIRLRLCPRTWAKTELPFGIPALVDGSSEQWP